MGVLAVLSLSACGLQQIAAPTCQARPSLALLAQAVPTASLVPCISSFPTGWSYDGMKVQTGDGRFWLSSDRAGHRVVEVVLAARCDVTGAVQIPSDEEGTERYERLGRVAARFSGSRYYLFEGGCVTYQFRLPQEDWSAVLTHATAALSFFSREDLSRTLREETEGLLEGL
jgi:hypothetical protein